MLFHLGLEPLGFCLNGVHPLVENRIGLKDLGHIQYGDHAATVFLGLKISCQREYAGDDGDDL